MTSFASACATGATVSIGYVTDSIPARPIGGRNLVKAVPCAHIALYYERAWDRKATVQNNILRCGYAGWAIGQVMSHNTLYPRATPC